MDSGKIFTVSIPKNAQSVQTNHVIGEEFSADYLSFKLVNKRSRVCLSEKPIDYNRLPGKSRLLAVGNKKGYLAAATCKDDGYYIVVALLDEFQKVMESSPSGSEPFIQFVPQKNPMKLPGTPHILTTAFNDEYLVVAFIEGPVLVYDAGMLLQVTQPHAQPCYSIPGPSATIARDIVPNPEENIEFIAILRETQTQEHHVDIFDILNQRHVIGWRQNNAETIPVSICWSPKGKQFGIGLKCGDALVYSLSSPEVPKLHIPRPLSIPPETSALLSISWVSNTAWHLVFSAPEACFANFNASSFSSLTKTHIMAIIDPRRNVNTTIELGDPSAPFGAQVAPGPLFLVLRSWNPMKYMVVCGDGPSADIGVIGSSTGESWANFSLEETATPSLPLNDDMEDMPLLGFELDLTSRESISLSKQSADDMPELPPSPILYAYVGDGTVVGWRILNSNGDRYPGMITADRSTSLPVQRPAAIDESPNRSDSPSSPPKPISTPTGSPFTQKTVVEQTTPSSVIAPAKGFGTLVTSTSPSKFSGTSFGATTETSTRSATSVLDNDNNNLSSLPPALSGFAAKSHIPTFGTSGYSMKPATPVFGISGFGARPQPTFGAPGFGAKPVFGQSGIASISNAPRPASVSSSGGFAAFAGQGTTGFGVQDSSNAPEHSSSASALSTLSIANVSTPSTETQNAPLTSAFSGSQSTKSFFGQPSFKTSLIKSEAPINDASIFGGLSESRNALDSGPVPPAIEGSPPGSLPSTPTGSPKAQAQTVSITPTSAYIKPASGFGAFVKPSGAFGMSSASYIKPAQAFGAFGGSTSNISIATGENKSSFTGGPGPKSTTTTPVFGSTTALRNMHPGSSGFGVSLPKPATSEPSKPITGGFSAFSSGSGFAGYTSASGDRSFSDLLSSSNSDLPKAGESPTSLASASVTPTSRAETGSIVQSLKQASILGSSKVEKEEASKDKPDLSHVETAHTEQKAPAMADSISQLSSFSLVSLSETLSESGQARNEEAVQSMTAVKDETGSEKDTEDFYASESAYKEKCITDKEDSTKNSVPASPELTSELSVAANMPLPETPSTATTPTPTTPKPPPNLSPFEEPISESKPVTRGPDRSTTPPASPQKPPFTIPVSPKPVNAVPSTPSPAGFGFGLGRPSSRPIRSSPLANAPITNEADVAKSAATKDDEIPVATPRQAIGHSPVMQGQSATQTVQAVAPMPLAHKRPKTPPPLSGKPATFSVQTQSVPQHAPTPSQQAIPLGSNGIPVASPFATQVSPIKLQSPTPQAQPELHPLQAEFLRIYEEVKNELMKIVDAHKFLLHTYPHPSRGGLEAIVKEYKEFAVNPMFSLAEAKFFKSIINRLHVNVQLLEEQREADRRLLQTLQNLALISDTKKEELERWVRVKKDPELAKSLKPRQLGPEHTENQIKLRKSLQIVHERVQQCEDEIERMKKKLEQEKTGRVTFHPPTLDTIDRTCRNIQLALDERASVLNQLNLRVEAMSSQTSKILKSSQASSPAVTPVAPFASVAATALNSERSALQLRDALLGARKRPLLTMASIPLDNADPFDVPPMSSLSPLDWQQPMSLGESTTGAFIATSTPSIPVSGSANRRRGSERKSNAVPLKSSPVSTAGSNKPMFDWGPLPGVTPMKTISSDVRTPKT